MGINMDIRNEPEYAFLDLDDLDDSEKNEIRAILRPSTGVDTLKLPWDIGEKEYELNSDVAEGEPEDVANQWHYGMAENMASYDGCGVATSPMLTTIPPHHYAGHQMITGYIEMPGMTNPYANSGDPNAYSFVPGLPYGPPPTMYSSGSELMTPAPSRDNEQRRGGRGRGSGGGGGGSKRDSYNRGSNINNDMQTSYVVPQPPYGQMMPMCHSTGALYSVPAQPHPQVGQPIFLPPQGRQSYGAPATQMYRNSHASYGHHPSGYQTESHIPNTNKYVRGSQGAATYYNQDSQKNVNQKHHETTRVLQRDNCPTSTPPFRHGSSNNESQAAATKGHGKSLIVNNTSANVETRNNNVHNNNSTRYSSDNKKKVTFADNHAKTDVSTDVSKTIKDDLTESVVEKKEALPAAIIDNNNPVTASCVVKDVKINREKENVVLPAEEKVSPAVSQAELPPPRALVKFPENVEQQNDAKVVSKIVPEEPIAAKVPETSAATLPTETASSVNIASAPPPPVVTSWANVLKKGGSPMDNSMRSTPPITKLPVARVTPISLPPPPVETVPPPKTSSQKVTRNESTHAVPTANRNSAETTPKAPESSAWAETKAPVETCQQNNLNDPTVFRMGELLIKYQMDKQTVSLLPRGLTNRSNYCYINSILQALLACPPFYNLLMALPYRRNATKNSSSPLIDNMIRFVREFNPLTDGARVPRKEKSQKRGEETAADVQCGVAFEPSYVYTMLKNTSCAGVFSVEGRQEDAEEFLSCLLNGISDEMLELMKLVNAESNETASEEGEENVNFNNGEEEWKVMGPKNKGSITRCTEFGRTPLSDIFRGQLRSRITRTGEDATDNVQPFFTLQLDIEKAESVEEALETLVGRDQVEGMTCSKTKQQIEAWKQVTLEELPVILILHLKWFDYKMDGCSKIFKRVGFPIDLKLDSKLLSPNVAKKLQRKQKQYKLFAVTYHDGKEASKGHYVTDAFHVGYGSWVRYDDSSVKGIYEVDVLNPSPPRVPYLLYYRRSDTIGNNPPNTPRTR